ncbi:hypothetical protein DNTS_030296, partial [Danionella cerebrum]
VSSRLKESGRGHDAQSALLNESDETERYLNTTSRWVERGAALSTVHSGDNSMDHRRTKPFLFLCVFLNGVFISTSKKEEVLLDMVASGAELGWLTSPVEHGWEMGQGAVNGSLLYNYYICNVEEREQDNWLRTTFIQRNPTASRVFVELRFVVRDCNSFNADSLTCKETFNLYISEADADIGTAFRKGQFRKVATIAPDEISSPGEMKMNTETKFVDNLSRKGFYLAFQDIGACIAIYSVRVYYKTCPATVQSLAAFPETVAGGENQGLREVAGSCVKNAVSDEQPRIYCTTEGEWVVPVSQCQCSPGFEAMKDACQALVLEGFALSSHHSFSPPSPSPSTHPSIHPSINVALSSVFTTTAPLNPYGSQTSVECQTGFFKSSVSTDACKPCPENTQPSGPGAKYCPCKDGFYRAPEDPLASACSGLPSAPPSLLATTAQMSIGKLQLSWKPPADTGGRSDISYSVLCERCEGRLCLTCGEKVRFEPGSTDLKETRVTVSELEPHLNYTFTVEARSGVSRFSTKRAISSINTALHYTDPPKVTAMHLVESSPTTLSLQWSVSHRAKPVSTRYELMYRKKENEEEKAKGKVTTYTVLVLEKNSVQISDLSPSTVYLFKVQALSSETNSGTYSMEQEFSTLPQGLQKPGNTAVILGAAIGGAIMLFIVVVVLFLRKRRRNSHSRQGPEDTYFSSPDQLKPLKTYVDPHTYEDPNTAVLKFASEIHPSHISKQKVIGAVKHAMIVTEYMENGALDKYLKCSVFARVSIRLPSTSGSDGSPFRTVAEWLDSIKMSQYSENFSMAGVLSMEQVLQMKSEDIRNIGVRLPGHLKRIAYSILGLKDQTSTLSVFAV